LPELAWQEKIANQMHWPGKFVVLPKDQMPKHLMQPGNVSQHIVVSSERIRTELHYAEPVAIDEAIRRTTDWEQQNPPSIIASHQFDYDAEDATLANH
jgi:nucleoside-diphosphate-sugar epimerase